MTICVFTHGSWTFSEVFLHVTETGITSFPKYKHVAQVDHLLAQMHGSVALVTLAKARVRPGTLTCILNDVMPIPVPVTCSNYHFL